MSPAQTAGPGPEDGPVSVRDKYDAPDRACLINGPQALVRLLLTQRRRDASAGLHTAGFVSGYRGSPLGGVDRALWEAQPWLERSDIIFQPGINEDLAATAVWGTQQLGVIKEPMVDGVFALWYGKGPGVDRSGDALKHGNYTGAHPKGGVLLVLGDDHPGKSSTIAHQSEPAMVAQQIPVLYPAHVGEIIEFGLLGWALSRHSGCWVALKLVNETIEQTATIAPHHDLEIVLPETSDLPPEGVHYRGVFAAARDEIIHKRHRLPMALRFCRANRLDRVEFGHGNRRLGIVTAGKAYGDVLQALRYLGIDPALAAEIGLEVYKVGMVWPLEPEGLTEFADGCEELLFVEEKSAFLEQQAAATLYNAPQRPRIVGKRDEQGRDLLPSDLQLDPLSLADVIARRLASMGALPATVRTALAALQPVREAAAVVQAPAVRRLPYFCSGCPHSTSTNVPEGSVAMSGIGCHGMAMWAKPGTTLMGTHMGAEGVTWAALQHFTGVKHVFQNLGDGTYFHSGLLAIRQSVAAGSNITYKILFNDAVAMTGGQPVDGALTPAGIAHQVVAEGARQVAIVAEDLDPRRYGRLPVGVTLHERGELDVVQRRMRDVPGCTVIIYDQVCAAEKRRRRKRGLMPEPAKRVVINPEVCEGCGDCSARSGCVSIEPLETPLGRKRQINQSSCNKDFSCTQGFCPSFVTLEGVRPRKRHHVAIDEQAFAGLPAPAVPELPSMGVGIMLAGIGGTGVITVGAVLAMAAHVRGLQSSAYDMTGISQKNGAVLSHVRICGGNRTVTTQSLGAGEADLVLAFDAVAMSSPECARTICSRTRIVSNTHAQPTASFSLDPNETIDAGLIVSRIADRVGADRSCAADATKLALALMGDAIAANFFMVGIAYQKGWLPFESDHLMQAIRLNGVQVEFNLRAFNLGRLWVHDAQALESQAGEAGASPGQSAASPADLIDQFSNRLVGYQDAGYADRYRRALAPIAAAESRAVPGQHRLTSVAAQALYRLMAYKDEYEVARLHLDAAFGALIHAQFEGRPRLRFHLAPPLLAPRDPVTGVARKREFGPWVVPIFRLLRAMRRLRGTVIDPFGHTRERKEERRLAQEFEALLDEVAASLGEHNHRAAVDLLSAFLEVRGYGHVKERSIARLRQNLPGLLSAFRQGPLAVGRPRVIGIHPA